jgi:hypothetical protein
MKRFFLTILSTSLLFFASCSKDNNSSTDTIAPKTFNELTITTIQPIISANNLSFASGGNLSFTLNFEYGICYNTIGNPTLNDNFQSSYQLSGNIYDCVVSNLTFGATYYVKAYARDFSTGQIKYGNELSIQIPFSLTTGIVKEITSTGFKVDVLVGTPLSSNTERGVCYSTSQNPTISNEKIPDATYGSGIYSISVDNLGISPNYYVTKGTTYYLKSYVYINGSYYYGNQVSFKVAGYTGGSGGIVFYDKGEITNGWRYLEAAPSHFVYNSDVNWFFSWNNCSSTSFISSLSTNIGTGYENTYILKPLCNYTNNAAAMSVTSLNGKSDWFLPSLDELKALYKAKYVSSIHYNDVYTIISSSQLSNNTNYGVDFSNGNTTSMFKTAYGRFWQVRRF